MRYKQVIYTDATLKQNIPNLISNIHFSILEAHDTHVFLPMDQVTYSPLIVQSKMYSSSLIWYVTDIAVFSHMRWIFYTLSK